MTKGYWRGKRCCFFNKFRPLVISVRACVCTCLRMRAPFSLSRLSLYPPTRNCFVNHCPISVHGSSQMTTLRTELKRQLKRQSPEACQLGGGAVLPRCKLAVFWFTGINGWFSEHCLRDSVPHNCRKSKLQSTQVPLLFALSLGRVHKLLYTGAVPATLIS